MKAETTQFDPSEFCSRKLWELVSEDEQSGRNERELREAIAELAARRHYLKELQDLGKI